MGSTTMVFLVETQLVVKYLCNRCSQLGQHLYDQIESMQYLRDPYVIYELGVEGQVEKL